MAVSLTKRQFDMNDEHEIIQGVSIPPKRQPKIEPIRVQRPLAFPHIEVNVEQMIRNSNKTSYTPEEVEYLVSTAVRVNEQKLRQEYDKILNDKLNEQYQNFYHYSKDYLSKQYGDTDVPYYS
ncbi:MAG: hypothetical protein MR354_08330 [Bacteroides xylanisolvens]|nr:hypothetical protein [Bacteroides xylanisolvens]